MNIFRLFWNMIWYMTGWGVLGGAGLGAVYGIVLGSIIQVNMERGSVWNALPGILVMSVIYGAPFGAFFGGIAGALLGMANGLSMGVLTLMIFSLSRNWGWYCLSVWMASVGVALVGGTVIFSLFIRPYSLGDFMLHAGIPALVAAVVFARASQRAAQRHLAMVTASQPVVYFGG
jgi:hypothetical protein